MTAIEMEVFNTGYLSHKNLKASDNDKDVPAD